MLLIDVHTCLNSREELDFETLTIISYSVLTD